MDKQTALVKLENGINDILLEVADDLTPEDLNEHYGFMNDCQLAEMLRELKS